MPEQYRHRANRVKVQKNQYIEKKITENEQGEAGEFRGEPLQKFAPEVLIAFTIIAILPSNVLVVMVFFFSTFVLFDGFCFDSSSSLEFVSILSVNRCSQFYCNWRSDTCGVI